MFLELVFRLVELELIGGVELDAVVDAALKLGGRSIPDACDSLVHVRLAGSYHLVGDLDEERGDAFGGVVIRGDAVDHTDGVDEARDEVEHRRLATKAEIMIRSCFE